MKMPFIAVADAIWLAAIGGAVTIVGGLVTVLLAWIKLGADRIAKEQSKRDAASALVQADIHTLVNSNMGAVLKVNMLQAKRIAELSKAAGLDSASGDALIAEEAERLWKEHQKKQTAVDLGVEDRKQPKP